MSVIVRRYATSSGWCVAVYDGWDSKLGRLASLRYRRYFYGPQARERALAWHSEGEQA